ncbi:MAG: hypothetical protein PHW66_02345 [Gallionella sp.]|nr:hypothetical protein [Gallionella sp.]
MIYEFHPEALYEFQESAIFYSSQQPGLGDRFIAAVQSAVDHIVSSPEAWSDSRGRPEIFDQSFSLCRVVYD